MIRLTRVLVLPMNSNFKQNRILNVIVNLNVVMLFGINLKVFVDKDIVCDFFQKVIVDKKINIEG